MIQEAIKILSKGDNLSSAQMTAAMEEIMSGSVDTSAIISFLTGLSEKTETVEELSAAVSVMRKFTAKIPVNKQLVLDTCGTGGDAKGTFNISTASAFVAAGCGIVVAKHGNRSISSKAGSADILEALGININLSKEQIGKSLDTVGMAFLFAPNLHPAMKYVMPARKQIGKRTMFNLLGPLCNPVCPTHQLLGVYADYWRESLAEVLRNLDIIHALVVYGEDGLDEITTTGKTFISEVNNGKIYNYEIKPEDFSLRRADLKDLKGGDAHYNAEIVLDILQGTRGPQRDIVVLNAAAAIYAADKAGSIKEAIDLAAESIDSGKALEKLRFLQTNA